MSQRRCPFRSCGVSIPGDRFACPGHWGRLSAKQKARIWHAYDEWTSGAISLVELRAEQNRVLVELQGLFAQGEDDHAR